MPAGPSVRSDHQYVLELLRENGEAIGQSPVAPDWEPAVEWTRLAGLRAHGVWAGDSASGRYVEPLWHATLGEPHISGFRVHLAAPGVGEWCSDFPIHYFAEAAREASAKLVESGVLTAGDRVRFRATAYARSDAAAASTPLRFDTHEAPAPLALTVAPLAPLLAASAACGDAQAGDLQVFLPTQALEEATALTEEAAARETGGILIGHLHHDPDTRELFAEVTAQIPARHTVGDSVKLTFTSDTWTDVRGAIALRRRHEIMLGWWHSHPAREWCKACPPERQQVCRLSTGFLSADDRALHRAMFPRAFGLALVLTNALAGIDTALFGWRAGLLERRGFHWIGGTAPAHAADGAPAPARLVAAPDTVVTTEPCTTRPDRGADAGPSVALASAHA